MTDLTLPPLSSFPSVGYLAHSFSLAPHPVCGELSCVALGPDPVTNEHEEHWLLARRLGITASGFSSLITRAGTPAKGRKNAVKAKVLGFEKDMSHIAVIQLGNEYEPVIAEKVKAEYGVAANHWLVAQTGAPRFLATPDGLAPDLVAEYKTSIKSWGQNLYSYYRQIQWQMFVTGRDQSVFAVFHPHTHKFMAGLVPRDDAEIELLQAVATEVLMEIDEFGMSLG